MTPPTPRGSGLSFEAVYRRIADKAAKRAEEAKAREQLAALLVEGVPVRVRPTHGGKQYRKSKLGLIVRRTNR